MLLLLLDKRLLSMHNAQVGYLVTVKFATQLLLFSHHDLCSRLFWDFTVRFSPSRPEITEARR